MRALALLMVGGSVAWSAGPTFHKDIAPILFAQCTTCHRDGEIGPFKLESYDDAQKRAKQIARVTGEKIMPPWKPDAGSETFHEARVLTKKQIETIAAWAEDGAPEGDVKDAPPKPKFPTGWKLGKPDLVLKMAERFKVPASGKDIYHQFVFPLDFKTDKHLIGLECRPGNPKVAHHAVGILDKSGTAHKLDAKHEGEGYPGIGPGFLPSGFTPGYVPGQTPRLMLEGTAITIQKGTDFVLQMHYHPSGKEEFDQTEIAFYFTDKAPTKPIVLAMLSSEEIDIKPGTKKYEAADEYTLPADMTVTSIWPHMHLLGKSVKVTAKLPDGNTKPLLAISDWDFNWQDTYQYKEHFKLPKGTVIRSEFTWDNSKENPRNPFSPPQRIRLGEGSDDEMSGLIIGGYSSDWVAALHHFAAIVGHYIEVKARGWSYQK